MRFADRSEAGRRLGEHLARLDLSPPVVVVGLARGGVPVAAEVAAALGAPLEVLVVRKLGYPPQPELGVGALAEGGAHVVNRRLVAQLGLTAGELEEVVLAETAELERRVARYRHGRPRPELGGRTVVLVDDGLATGYTARAAVASMRDAGAGRVVLAVPVAARDALAALRATADDVVCLQTPPDLFSIGEWYDDFRQVRHEDVEAILAQYARARPSGASAASGDGVRSCPAEIPAGGRVLSGELVVPTDAAGVVLFAHGSGSSRHSPRNRAVAETLQRAGLATLLFDLLTDQEADSRANVFDVALLAGRVVDAVQWVAEQPSVSGLPLGLFGASTGAAAALVAAAEVPGAVQAVVSRGGRPDLAGARLEEVMCPVLLVVGGSDKLVVELNRQAARQLRCPHELLVVPGATHLFEEPGTLDVVAASAGQWFLAAFGRAPVAH